MRRKIVRITKDEFFHQPIHLPVHIDFSPTELVVAVICEDTPYGGIECTDAYIIKQMTVDNKPVGPHTQAFEFGEYQKTPVLNHWAESLSSRSHFTDWESLPINRSYFTEDIPESQSDEYAEPTIIDEAE